MTRSKTTLRDEQRGLSRRALIKWSLATGAALGVSRSKIADILEKHAGTGVAMAATELPMCRSIHIMAGGGGFAWFNLLWPHNTVAAANNSSFAWHKPGMSTRVVGTDKPLTIGPDTPFANLAANQQMTAFVCGKNAAHAPNTRDGSELNGAKIYAIASALQSANPSVIRAVAFGGLEVEFGQTAGSAVPSTANVAVNFVDLFNSAASRAGGLLEKSNDADLYKAHYQALASLNAAANRTTTKTSYTTATGAAKFLGRNLAAQLSVTPEDRDRYGIDGNMRQNVKDIGEIFIVAVKAFKMGLTNCIAMPAMTNSDPHNGFATNDVSVVAPMLKRVFDGLMNDLRNTPDDVSGRALDQDTVITIHGDTPKDPFNCSADWNDGTPNNSNWAYVYSAGHLKSGWFGGATPDGKVEGFDATGNNTAGYDPVNTAQLSNASIAYAIAKRDERAISQFANGIKVSGIFGRPKES
jgi:hypothetical protein